MTAREAGLTLPAWPRFQRAADALTWIGLKRPPLGTAAAVAVITLLTGFIAWIVRHTVILALHGQLFPRPD